MLLFHLRFPGFSPCSRPGFPCLLFRFYVLGFLYVSFRPSLLRSHSCSTGAHHFPSFDFPLAFFHTSAFFRPLPLRFRLLSLCFFFSLLPDFPSQRALRCCLSIFRSACFHASLLILVLSLPALPFSAHRFCLTGATPVAGLLFPARPSP